MPVEVPATAIPRVRLSDAGPVLGAGGGAPPGRLTHQAEQALCRYARRQAGHSLVFVTGYPAAERPFYTHRDDDPGAETRSFDLLWGGMEVGSGCQREHRADVLRAQAQAAGIGTEAMARYLDRHWLPMFEHGCPPHGGFGLGLDRLLMALCRPGLDPRGELRVPRTPAVRAMSAARAGAAFVPGDRGTGPSSPAAGNRGRRRRPCRGCWSAPGSRRRGQLGRAVTGGGPGAARAAGATAISPRWRPCWPARRRSRRRPCGRPTSTSASRPSPLPVGERRRPAAGLGAGELLVRVAGGDDPLTGARVRAVAGALARLHEDAGAGRRGRR